MQKSDPLVQEFYDQSLHIVEVYRTSDFSFDDQLEELDQEIGKALDILIKMGKGDFFANEDVFNFFNNMHAFGLLEDITTEELLYRIDQDILVSPFTYEYWFRLGNIYGFSSKFEIGNGLVIRFEDLPDDVREGFSAALEYKIKTGKSEHNKKPVESGWYLHVKLKSIGEEKARQRAVMELKRCINILKFFYDPSNAMHYFDTATIIDYCVKCEGDIPKMWEGRRYSGRPLERTFITESESLTDITGIVRKSQRTELEERILNAIEVYGMIEESTPMHMRFLLCMVALEGLLMDQEGSIRKLLPLKVSRLVSDSAEWLMRLFKADEGEKKDAIVALKERMLEMYKTRSNFAHTGQANITRGDFGFLSAILKMTVKKVIALRNQGYNRISRGNVPDEKYLNHCFPELK